MNEENFDRYLRNGNEEKKFRLLFIGCAGVGKTSLITRYINNMMSTSYKPTDSIV